MRKTRGTFNRELIVGHFIVGGKKTSVGTGELQAEASALMAVNVLRQSTAWWDGMAAVG